MHFAIPAGKPEASTERVVMRRGAKRIVILFAATIATAVCFHNFMHLPPFLGMMTGLAYLQFFSYYLKKSVVRGDGNVIAVGVLSAIIDNIPVMFAVLNMNPSMDLGQWLLVTLTAGVGGSMLSIGSAAGVALMGQARGKYTFFGHLKWTPAIIVGYAASIAVHMWINADTFSIPI
jgi:hypothetical protein